MILQNDSQVANTRAKLRLLENSDEEVLQETGADDELRDAEMESRKRFINQLKEEIARYEAHQAVSRWPGFLTRPRRARRTRSEMAPKIGSPAGGSSVR